jgi:hypothetical protein
MVQAAIEQGITCDQIAGVLPASKFRSVDGPVAPEALWDTMVAQLDLKRDQDHRWHLHAPIEENGKVWVLHSNWGTRTDDFLKALGKLTGGTVRAVAQTS